MPMLEILYTVTAIAVAAIAVKVFVLDKVRKRAQSDGKTDANAARIAVLGSDVDRHGELIGGLAETLRRNAESAAVMGARLDAAFQRIDELRDDGRKTASETRAAINLVYKALSAQIGSSLTGGNNTEELRRIKKLLDEQMTIV